ncbi:hypothetical protein EON67_06965, partial [archaeon]
MGACVAARVRATRFPRRHTAACRWLTCQAKSRTAAAMWKQCKMRTRRASSPFFTGSQKRASPPVSLPRTAARSMAEPPSPRRAQLRAAIRQRAHTCLQVLHAAAVGCCRTYFRYFKVDLWRQCPFWEEDGVCFIQNCAVCECDQSEVPV